MTGADAVTNLPPLQPEEARHGALVSQAVHAAIDAHGGWLAFDDYLRIVQYAPGLGYYSAGSAKLGRGGDFVTAPELSGLFGRCVARQCAQVLQLCGGEVLELGADRNASMHLLGHAAIGLIQVFSPEKSASDHLSEVDATVAIIRARNQTQLAC